MFENPQIRQINQLRMFRTRYTMCTFASTGGAAPDELQSLGMTAWKSEALLFPANNALCLWRSAQRCSGRPATRPRARLAHDEAFWKSPPRERRGFANAECSQGHWQQEFRRSKTQSTPEQAGACGRPGRGASGVNKEILSEAMKMSGLFRATGSSELCALQQSAPNCRTPWTVLCCFPVSTAALTGSPAPRGKISCTGGPVSASASPYACSSPCKSPTVLGDLEMLKKRPDME